MLKELVTAPADSYNHTKYVRVRKYHEVTKITKDGETIISHLKVTTKMQSHNSFPSLKLWLRLSENWKSRTFPSLHFPPKINEEPQGMTGSALSLRLSYHIASEYSTRLQMVGGLLWQKRTGSNGVYTQTPSPHSPHIQNQVFKCYFKEDI